MGIVRTNETQRIEIEEFRRLLLSSAGVRRSKYEQEEEEEDLGSQRRLTSTNQNDDVHQKLVCVTSGVSFLGLAIVNQLLLRGYSVRIIVDNQEEIEHLREMRGTNNRIGVVMAKLDRVESLAEVFNGCYGIFHTAAFIDPAGLSGYSKFMAEIEVKAAENVIEACAMTPSVRNCMLTSSLLACTWQNSSLSSVSPTINHDCWSDESLCMEKKLWYALGKLRAEKAAYRVAEQRGLRLASICPGLVTGPGYFSRNSTSTIAYLKGAQEMYENGVLATVDVNRVAEAHLVVFEEMNKTAFGRYICFDQVIRSDDEIRNLEQETGLQSMNLESRNASENNSNRFQLSNIKLTMLMSRTFGCHNS